MIEMEVKSASGLPKMGPFVEGGVLTAEQLNKLYSLLQFPLSEEAVKQAPREQTKKKYDQTGYQVQFIINRLNEVLGPAHYRFYYENETLEKGTWGSNKPCYTVNTDAILEFGNWVDGQFIPLARSIGTGGKTSDSMEDARKGARTGGRKLAAASFGIGRKAYEGTLDADFTGPVEDQGIGQQAQGSRGNNGQRTQGNNRGNNGQHTQGNSRGNNGQKPQGNSQGNNGQSSNRGNGYQGNGGKNQGRNSNLTLDIFTGKIKLTDDADVGSENTPDGPRAYVKIYGIAMDNRPVLVEGWGTEMLPLMADLVAGQSLMIQGAKTRLNSQNVLRIALNVSNFSVTSAA